MTETFPIQATAIQTRRRVNISRMAKGNYNFDFTIECYGDSPDEILAESDRMRLELEARYPMKEEK